MIVTSTTLSWISYIHCWMHSLKFVLYSPGGTTARSRWHHSTPASSGVRSQVCWSDSATYRCLCDATTCEHCQSNST